MCLRSAPGVASTPQCCCYLPLLQAHIQRQADKVLEVLALKPPSSGPEPKKPRLGPLPALAKRRARVGSASGLVAAVEEAVADPALQQNLNEAGLWLPQGQAGLGQGTGDLAEE